MIIATTNEIAGHETEEVFGEVFGLTVRSRNVFSQFGAGLKSMVGGELKGMTTALVDSRQQVIDRMVEEAEAKGANAVVGMRFDTSEMGDTWTEICAYGTAVRVRRPEGRDCPRTGTVPQTATKFGMVIRTDPFGVSPS